MKFNPNTTYRIQFHKDFTFNSLKEVLPYLHNLGIKTIYASPVFEATPGSTHGYDITNPNKINPEIGTIEQLREIQKKLKEYGMSWIQDIVPNHMAFHPTNRWLMDVLEKGPNSEFASFFDILWSHKMDESRIMVPFLGASFDEVNKKGEIKIISQNGKYAFKYFDNLFPINKSSSETIKNEILDQINSSPQKISEIHNQQNYRLCHWQETNERINYRRFFTINGLISLNMDKQEVFDRYHKLIKQLLEEDLVQGLRVDHVDGMYDPETYLTQLRGLSGDKTYIIIEKILELDESLPDNWSIEGNTGYDFLALSNNLFSSNKSKKILTEYFHKITKDERSVEDRMREKKKNILYNRLAGDLQNLYELLISLEILEDNRFSENDLRSLVAEFLIECRIYRFYGNKMPLDEGEHVAIEQIFTSIRKKKPNLTDAANLLEKVLLHNPVNKDPDYKDRVGHFYKRLMQYTGPVMAKGVEDTLMYTYSRFIGHNEVGDNPSFLGITVDEFHEKMITRQEVWPLTMNTTSTHDTKRGEDVRMRLNVLTDIPEEWTNKVEEWRQLNSEKKENKAPDNNDEYFLYQTLYGSFPMPGQEEDNFQKRISEYITKALREAKRHSNWADPDEQYEQGVKKFAQNIMQKDSPFWKSFIKFHHETVDAGIINSLAQVILKYTCPGIPDLYQGTELWDLSLVDPDNRRSVDFQKRNEFLADTSSYHSSEEEFFNNLWKDRYSGKIKLWLTHQLIQLRQSHEKLLLKGEYIPLNTKGKYKDHIMAYCRKVQDSTIIVVIPLNLSSLENTSFQDLDWGNTSVQLLEKDSAKWQNPLAKSEIKTDGNLLVKEIFKSAPFGILVKEHALKEERSAGILMHITSLPSPFGVGDLGPAAYEFADFLERCKQSYWQILPLNPTEGGSGHSPYSSHSSMAGNILLISPELLQKDELISEEDVRDSKMTPTSTADFAYAEEIKGPLLEKAYYNFKSHSRNDLKQEYENFLNEESHWIDDFALYRAIKQKHNYTAWYDWPEEYKARNEEALEEFRKKNSEEIEKLRWYQFIFIRQWKKLKQYCNTKGINLFGDLPFYIAHDSVDVWSHPEIFKIDEEGKMTGIAGVPPDYFNEDGQLWGMPVFRWDILKKKGYDWWVKRIEKNVQLYDLLRLDHFRAFSAYWEVPAGETTAKNGVWKPGPGPDLFKKFRKKLGDLPFIAEDLGEIDEPVYDLRDSFNFPGMKVIQFGFGGDIKHSPHIPHTFTPNYIAYTGTHDNNTTVGWFRKDIGKTERKHLKIYLATEPDEQNIHIKLTTLLYGSVAKTAIVPIQDVIGLDENSRMNMPATIEKNWVWRLKPDLLDQEKENWLRELVEVFNRG